VKEVPPEILRFAQNDREVPPEILRFAQNDMDKGPLSGMQEDVCYGTLQGNL